jgi:hypothetical protein
MVLVSEAAYRGESLFSLFTWSAGMKYNPASNPTAKAIMVKILNIRSIRTSHSATSDQVVFENVHFFA